MTLLNLIFNDIRKFYVEELTEYFIYTLYVYTQNENMYVIILSYCL